MTFLDRQHAGRDLGAALLRERGPGTIVLGLPRGGVVVAAEVARALGAPLDVLVVRKLGAPGMPEYALGAIAEGGVVYEGPEARRVLAMLGAGRGAGKPGTGGGEGLPGVERETAELERRVRSYRQGRPPPDLRGRTAVLVDDGIATGSTVHAAVEAARRLGAARVVVAAPVGAPESLEGLRAVADEVVCLLAPEDFAAVGAWYVDFQQTSDDEVRAVLAAFHGGPCGSGGEG